MEQDMNLKSGFRLFPYRLRRLRELAQLSRAALSRATGLSESALLRWETGERKPNEESLAILAAYFALPESELLGDVGENVVLVGDIHVGFRTRIEHAVIIDATYGRVEIGDDCHIGTRVTILTKIQHAPEKVLTGAVKIGNKVIIAPGRVVGPDVTVPDGTKIG